MEESDARLIWAAGIAVFIALGVIATDIFVRMRRRILVRQLGLPINLDINDKFTEGLIGRIGDPGLQFLYLPAALVFAAVSALGLYYVLFPSESAGFLHHNFFLLSGSFETKEGSASSTQMQSAIAVFAGFTGAYAWSIRHFFLEIEAGRFSPYSFLVATGALLGGSLGTLVLWHIVAATAGATGIIMGTSALFAAQVVAGYLIARPVPNKMAEGVARLFSLHRNIEQLMPLQWIDGLGYAARRRLMLLQIYDVQNLATVNPLLLAVATPYQLNEIIDWIGQARMALRVPDEARLTMLRQQNVRTIFDLVDAARQGSAADDLGRVLLSKRQGKKSPAPQPVMNESSTKVTTHGGIPLAQIDTSETPPAVVIRLAENEQKDPAFQRLNAIRDAAGAGKALPHPRPAPATIGANTGFFTEDSSGTVVRYPEIAVERLIDGDNVKLAFSLTLHTDVSGEAGPKNWTDLAITVRLVCQDVDFEDDEGIIIVRRGEPSIPCRLIGQFRGGRTNIQVRALFYFGSRFCGSLARSFLIAHPIGAALTPIEDERPSAQTPIKLYRGSPGLTIEIMVDPKDRASQTWRLRSDRLRRSNGYYGKVLGRTSMQDTEEFLARYQEALRSPAPDQMLGVLHSMGLKLYRRSPDAFKEAYWFLRRGRDGGKKDFSIQILTEDGVTPFEFMVPEREGEEYDHLSVMHPVARWILSQDDSTTDPEPRIPPGDIGLVLPNYGALRDDVRPIGSYQAIYNDYERLHAKIASGITVEFQSLLAAKFALSILIYHGHGAAGDRKNTARLLLADDDIYDAAIDTNATTLGTRHHTLVLLNACQTGVGSISLGSVDGWPATLVRRNFGGVIAPLWDIDSDEAHKFALALISAFHARKTLGIALRELRAEFKDQAPSVLAYVCYADVMALVG